MLLRSEACPNHQSIRCGQGRRSMRKKEDRIELILYLSGVFSFVILLEVVLQEFLDLCCFRMSLAIGRLQRQDMIGPG